MAVVRLVQIPVAGAAQQHRARQRLRGTSLNRYSQRCEPTGISRESEIVEPKRGDRHALGPVARLVAHAGEDNGAGVEQAIDVFASAIVFGQLRLDKIGYAEIQDYTAA